MISGRLINLKTIYSLGFILFLMNIFPTQIKASHAAGTQMNYEYVGNDQYKVTYHLYRDCNGSLPPLSANLILKSVSCNQFSQYTLQRESTSGNEVTFICPSSATSCNGGNQPGIQEWIYSSTLTVPALCSDWVFSVSDCCRNSAITTLINPDQQGIYTTAKLNNQIGPNSTPTFTNRPVFFLSKGQEVRLNPGAVETDGDSLVYSLGAAFTGEGTSVNYATGYSAEQPLRSSIPITINSRTGEIHLQPSQQEVAVIKIQVKEYRNGILIGSIGRDIQVYVQSSTNQLPVLSGINGTSTNVAYACVNSPLSFSIFSNDNDLTQQLSVSIQSDIQNISSHTSTDLHPKTTFNWTPTALAIRNSSYLITLSVKDDACPSNGVQTYTYEIYVLPALSIAISTQAATCSNVGNGSAEISVLNGVLPYSFQWTGSNENSNRLENLAPGNYAVQVQDANGCIANESFSIAATAQPLVFIHRTEWATCELNPDGRIIAIATNGTEPYAFTWSNGRQGTIIDQLLPGNYTVQLTDMNGCTATATTSLGFIYPAPALNMTSNENSCKGTTLILDAGEGDFNYKWSDSTSTRYLTVESSGDYSVTITDINGCIASAQTKVVMNDCNPSERPGLAVVNGPSGKTTIKVFGVNESIHLMITNLSGQLLYSRDFSSSEPIEEQLFRSWATGVYIVRASGQSLVLTQKFVR